MVPQLWAFGETRNHRTCLTSCSSQTHWYFFSPSEATPATCCQSEERMSLGHAGYQETGWQHRDIGKKAGRGRRQREVSLSESAFPSVFQRASQVALVVKNPRADAGGAGSIPGSGRSLGGGRGNPLQYSCLENPMDRGAWRATVPGVAQSCTPLK